MVQDSLTCKPVASVSGTAEPHGLTALGPNWFAMRVSMLSKIHSLVCD